MKCLDSDFLVSILRGKEDVKDKVGKLKQENLFTTSINAYEILYGARISDQAEKNLIEVKEILSRISVVGFSEKSADISSRIYSELTKNDIKLELKDVLIASICIENGLQLVTRNIDHFSRIKDLKVEKW